MTMLLATPDLEKIDIIFTAMGDKSRRQIVYRLMDKNLSIKEIAEPLGISLTGASQHIKILENAGLLQTKKIGRNRICEFNSKGFEMIEFWAKYQKEMWQNRFTALKILLEEE